MGMADIMRKLGGAFVPPDDDVDPAEAEQRDYVTKDRYLRSLRREYRQRVLEPAEKEKLKAAIEEQQRTDERANLWGVKEESVPVRRKVSKRVDCGFLSRYKL